MTEPRAIIQAESGLAPVEEELSPKTALARIEGAAAIAEAKHRVSLYLRELAIKLTSPQDWVIHGTGDAATASLCVPGALVIKQWLEIGLENFRPRDQKDGAFRPREEKLPNGERKWSAWCDAESRFLGLRELDIEESVLESQEFTGRRGPNRELGELGVRDILVSMKNRLTTKAVVAFTGLKSVPIAELDAAWRESGKSTTGCRRGHGYGRGSDRKASGGSEASAQLLEGRNKLWSILLQRVDGDTQAAHKLLKEITANPNPKSGKPFAGNDSVSSMTEPWQFQRAYDNLAQHSVFGDDARGKPGE